MKKQLSLIAVLLIALNATTVLAKIPILDPVMDSANTAWSNRIAFMLGAGICAGVWGYHLEPKYDDKKESAAVFFAGGVIASGVVLGLQKLLSLQSEVSGYIPPARSVVPALLALLAMWPMFRNINVEDYNSQNIRDKAFLYSLAMGSSVLASSCGVSSMLALNYRR